MVKTLDDAPAVDGRILPRWRRFLPGSRIERAALALAWFRTPAGRARQMARGLRACLVMRIDRAVIYLVFNDLLSRLAVRAGQKARIGGQGLPGAARGEELILCR